MITFIAHESFVMVTLWVAKGLKEVVNGLRVTSVSV